MQNNNIAQCVSVCGCVCVFLCYSIIGEHFFLYSRICGFSCSISVPLLLFFTIDTCILLTFFCWLVRLTYHITNIALYGFIFIRIEFEYNTKQTYVCIVNLHVLASFSQNLGLKVFAMYLIYFLLELEWNWWRVITRRIKNLRKSELIKIISIFNQSIFM